MRECPIQPDLSVRIALKVKAMAMSGLNVYYAKTGRGCARHLYIAGRTPEARLIGPSRRTRQSTTARSLRGRAARPASRDRGHPSEHQARAHASVVLRPVWRRLWGQRELEEKLGPLPFHGLARSRSCRSTRRPPRSSTSRPGRPSRKAARNSRWASTFTRRRHAHSVGFRPLPAHRRRRGEQGRDQRAYADAEHNGVRNASSGPARRVLLPARERGAREHAAWPRRSAPRRPRPARLPLF